MRTRSTRPRRPHRTVEDMAESADIAWALAEFERRFAPATAEGLRATLLLLLLGPGGGPYHLTIEGGRLATHAGRHVHPDVQIEIRVADLCALLRGELAPHTAFLEGRVHLLGDGALAFRLRGLLGLDSGGSVPSRA